MGNEKLRNGVVAELYERLRNLKIEVIFFLRSFRGKT